MIFDVDERNSKMLKFIDQIQELITDSKVEGFLVMLRLHDGAHKHFMFPGRITDFEWIGAVEMMKFNLSKAVQPQRTDDD